MKRIRNNALAALILFALCLQCALPAQAAQADAGAVYIATVEDWRAFVNHCALDTWSRGRTVVLTGDLSLHDVDVSPVPSFGGVFEGGGHQITGLDLTGAVSPAGLFGIVQSGGEIRNLTVSGSVRPGGEGEIAGGIAGKNNGTISNCAFSGSVTGEDCVGGVVGVNGPEGTLRRCISGGTVTGKSMTGGVAGKNEGVISSCRNNAYVNISGVDPGVSPSDLDLDFSRGLLTLQSLDTVNIVTDTGGVAGYSSGMILSSANYGAVGYPHVGYNAGGIVGRTSGYVDNCENNGAVYGRRDIGGIAGQAEPYVELRLNADRVSALQGELEQMRDLVDGMAEDAAGSSKDISAILSAAGDAARSAVDGGHTLAEQTLDYAGETITELDRGSELIADTVDRLSDISADLTPMSEDVTKGVGRLEQAIRELEATGEFASDALEALESAAGYADTAREGFTAGARLVTEGLEELDRAVSASDEAAARQGLEKIRQGMRLMSSASAGAGEAMDDLGDALAATPESEQAVQDLKAATEQLSQEAAALSESIERLRDSVEITAETDEEWAEVNGALDELAEGNTELIAAAGKTSQAASDWIASEEIADPIERERQRNQARNELGDALGEISDATGKISESLDVLRRYISVDAPEAIAAIEEIETGLAAVSRDAGAAADAAGRLVADAAGRIPEVERALREFGAAFSDVAAAFSALDQGIALLEDAGPDLDSLQWGLREVLRGLERMEDASDSLGNASARLVEALRAGDEASGQLSAGLGTLADAAGIFGGVSAQATGVLRKTEDLLRDLSAADPIQISPPPEEINDSIDAIYAALNKLGDNLQTLNSRGLNASNTLTGDVRDINAQFGAVTDALLELFYDLEHPDVEDRIRDTSAEDADNVTTGKLRGCVNHAAVAGDINVGGVAGSMSIEYEFDPENDLLAGSTSVYRREYAMKAILQRCENDGAVTARRDYAGSICGRVDLGLVTQCAGLGSAESESGDYVGGITGYSAGTVRDSFAKCVLSGRRYVGGVTGAQAGDAAGSAGGLAAGCVSFVRVDRAEQYAGAVSGSAGGEFVNNRFVSDTLAGLDGVSAAGRAEPVSYAELLETTEDLPDAFRNLTLRFLVDDEVLTERTFDYGASFGPETFPAIPEREDSFGVWDRTELSDLRFDTDVHAVYAPWLTALASETLRNDGRPAFLAEGAFRDTERLAARKTDADAAAELRQRTPFYRRAPVEQWSLAVPEGAGAAYTLRYLSPNGDANGLELWGKNGELWQKLDTESFGSYLRFTVPEGVTLLAVTSYTPLGWVWALLGAAVLALVILLVALLKRRKRRKAERARRAKAAETRAADGNEPVDDTAAETPRPPAGKKKRRKRWLIPVVAVLCAGAAVAAGFALGLWPGAAAWRLLAGYASAEELSMELTVEAEAGEQRYYLDTDLYRMTVDGKRVMAARRSGLTFWYCDGLVYLDNGRAFSAGGLSPLPPEHTALLEDAVALFRETEVTVFESSGEKIYTITAGGAAARRLIESLLPQTGAYLAELADMQMELVERGGALYALRVSGSGAVADGDDGETKPVDVSATLLLQSGKQAPELPARVRARIAGDGGEDAGAVETPDGSLLRLLSGWLRLNAADPLTAEVSLSADCGPVILSDRLEWSRYPEDGHMVNRVRKNGMTLYYSDGAVRDENGNAVTGEGDGDGDGKTPETLLKLAYRLCMLGEPEYTARNETEIYTLRLDENAMAELFETLLPDAGTLNVTLTGGTAAVTLREGRITAVRFDCGGEVRLLAVTAPVSLSAELTF